MMILTAPFRPQFGVGLPPISATHLDPYFDTSTNPYTAYVYHGGQWNPYGVSGTGIDATDIQGVPVSTTAPTTGEVLTYNAGQWAPA